MEPEYASVGKETGLEIENELTPSGISGSRLKLNVGESRMRAKYWRELPDGSWVQTGSLPADQLSMAQYFAKGFKGKPPVDAPAPVEPTGIKCPLCEFSCETPRGLGKHMYSHNDKKEEPNELS